MSGQQQQGISAHIPPQAECPQGAGGQHQLAHKPCETSTERTQMLLRIPHPASRPHGCHLISYKPMKHDEAKSWWFLHSSLMVMSEDQVWQEMDLSCWRLRCLTTDISSRATPPVWSLKPSRPLLSPVWNIPCPAFRKKANMYLFLGFNFSSVGGERTAQKQSQDTE